MSFKIGVLITPSHRWTASFAYNLFRSIDWTAVARARR